MNEEYLWQKTGEDPEIMELENALSRFRYTEDSPPIVQIPVSKPARSMWRFALAFATPAFAAIAITSLWFQTSSPRNDEITFVHHPAQDATEAPSVVEPPPAFTEPIVPSPKPLRRGVQPTTASTKTTRSRRRRSTALTKEERDAYDQVVLALSISSSSLNVVRDTMNGVGGNADASKQNNR